MRNQTFPIPPNGFDLWPAWIGEHCEVATRVATDPATATRFRAQIEHRAPSEQTLQVYEYGSLIHWQAHQYKTVFPEAHVCVACEHTDVLDSVNGADLRWPYPVFAFYFPREYRRMVDPEHGTFIVGGVLNFHNEQSFKVGLANGTKIELHMPYSPYLAIVFFWSDKTLSTFCLPLQSEQTIGSVIAENERKLIPGERQMEMTEEHGERTARVSETLLSMVLLMQSYPEYVEKIGCKQRINGKGRLTEHLSLSLPSALRQQITVGMKHQQSLHPGDQRAAHWRRGHWRRQPHGNRWATEHPDVQPIIDHRARTCHMDWILPSFVSSSGLVQV